MSKLLKNFIGIDISKSYFDAAFIKTDAPGNSQHQQFTQNESGFKKMIRWPKQQGVLVTSETLFCMEYTGLYNTGLVSFLTRQKALVWVEMPLRIKKSTGFERGSNDKTSAVKIAGYAFRYQDKRQLWRPLDSSIERIKNLIAQRDRIITSITQLTVPIKELNHCGCVKEAKELEKLQRKPLKALQKSKEDIERLIIKTVKQDEQIDKRTQNVQSIKGIGPITAVSLLAYTKGFTSFDNAKQLACYAGVVPFSKTSGSSVRYKPTVSQHANKKLKKLLHLCALSAIKNDKEIRAYFERKVGEGKNKMCVINAVRNKLIHRVFAVIRDDRFFEENYVRKCA
jgi:transposase